MKLRYSLLGFLFLSSAAIADNWDEYDIVTNPYSNENFVVPSSSEKRGVIKLAPVESSTKKKASSVINPVEPTEASVSSSRGPVVVYPDPIPGKSSPSDKLDIDLEDMPTTKKQAPKKETVRKNENTAADKPLKDKKQKAPSTSDKMLPPPPPEDSDGITIPPPPSHMLDSTRIEKSEVEINPIVQEASIVTGEQSESLTKSNKELSDGLELFQRGTSSWYGGKFHGRKTASGEIFNQENPTVAHRTLPFGTEVILRNVENGKEIKAVVTDRGPFVKGKILDVSKMIARELGFLINGSAQIEIFRLN